VDCAEVQRTAPGSDESIQLLEINIVALSNFSRVNSTSINIEMFTLLIEMYCHNFPLSYDIMFYLTYFIFPKHNKIYPCVSMAWKLPIRKT
jgi:hypothetical protein